jgi:hypothetical protein
MHDDCRKVEQAASRLHTNPRRENAALQNVL